jgi:SAM-dependent methyltransferase
VTISHDVVVPEADGWENWRWDETLFEGAAAYYALGRLPYAPGIGDALRAALGLDGTRRLLDVGCGPGTITLPLAPLFADAVGLDADAGMVAEAQRAAAAGDVGNARFVHARAEELPLDLAPVRVVTFAASFHWMDRPRVASIVHGMLEPGGAAVQVHAPGYRLEDTRSTELPYPSPPDEAMDALRVRYLGSRLRAGQTTRTSSPSGENEIFQAAGFPPMEEIRVPDGRVLERSVDELVALRFSSSSTAPHLFGDRQDAFEADLRALLLDASPSGRFSVQLPDNELRIWRR